MLVIGGIVVWRWLNCDCYVIIDIGIVMLVIVDGDIVDMLIVDVVIDDYWLLLLLLLIDLVIDCWWL